MLGRIELLVSVSVPDSSGFCLHDRRYDLS
jgi:hypothetical protein